MTDDEMPPLLVDWAGLICLCEYGDWDHWAGSVVDAAGNSTYWLMDPSQLNAPCPTGDAFQSHEGTGSLPAHWQARVRVVCDRQTSGGEPG
ncbi:hypothetical protein [Mycolicibacterium rhodesiae]|uniref:Uncharacterized protein n=1 Tax=Mycolicibacterium rhodesiae TaxID=36814 RepID=A0A1X0IK51_MYCRH|nr:hypothetical protein [Mycolicibacterium rhodesiae]MCV7342968.1 hypothetical protein [Mycolicibacterium rhodesiae]ORB47767.1 hypothetical protein BST42_27035 [Mycolicibacterium rhodesiae]